ncbi:DUF397 domain-containing protein [Streptomyces sp. NBC_00878]|jgi:hypothetical protein|uniref:DUF397 domain-containing protein n=1 Tax=Streptomyces sp. NBC_00878 TaxID=2975854 RepID=UPI002255D223|nr:DUF397 domain-containing protein [Streptomyces sp. NBC_00878]MCX4906630.1 DUF397 domain-containing protein [Streptomyces sp. NBC_00878]
MSLQWQKSSFSGIDAEDCVELAHHEGQILIRESDAPDKVITAIPARLQALLGALKAER